MTPLRSGGVARGTAEVPGSKSLSNRALVCAALASGTSHLHGASESDDVALMSNALNQLGVLVLRRQEMLEVQGSGGTLYAPKFPIPVGNAGTTLRFLLALSCLATGKVVLEGNERMGERPNDELLDALAQLGGQAKRWGLTPRFEVVGGGLRGGSVHLSATRSSQFLTAVLLVSPYAQHDVHITLDGPISSRAYIGMTLDIMARFGIIVGQENGYVIKAKSRYHSADVTIEPDASSATYPWAAAAITGGEVHVGGISASSTQADMGFLHVIKRMGATVRLENGGLTVQGTGTLTGVDVDMNSMPDAVPTVAAMALFADGPTRIRNVAHLRHKESDRLEGLAGELRKLGAQIIVCEDGLEIHPAKLGPADLSTIEDHRLAMSFALVGLRVPGVRIDNPACVRKSFPRFWEVWDKLFA